MMKTQHADSRNKVNADDVRKIEMLLKEIKTVVFG